MDVLRGIACILVFFAHDLKTFYNIDTFFGKMGVDILFLFTGLLAHRSLRNFRDQPSISCLWRFYIKRIVRIVPLYILSLIPYSFIIGLDMHQFINHIFMINVSGHYWTITVEMLFYLIVPFLVLLERIARKKSIVRVLYLILSAVIWSFSFCGIYSDRASLIFWLPVFFLGMSIDIVDKNGKRMSSLPGGDCHMHGYNWMLGIPV